MARVVAPAALAPAAPSPPDRPQTVLARRLAVLPKYYDYKDVLRLGFEDDVDAFVEAYAAGWLPPAVRRVVEDTMPPRTLECQLLRRILGELQRQGLERGPGFSASAGSL